MPAALPRVPVSTSTHGPPGLPTKYMFAIHVRSRATPGVISSTGIGAFINKLWGGPPGPRPTPSSASRPTRQAAIKRPLLALFTLPGSETNPAQLTAGS